LIEYSPHKREEVVTVTVDGVKRHFLLRRFTVESSVAHLRVQETAWNAAVKECKGSVGDPLELTKSSAAYLKGIAPRVVSLLQEPADFGEPLTKEEFWKLDPGEPSMVIEAQNELSNLSELTAKGLMLQELAKERIIADVASGARTCPACNSIPPGAPQKGTTSNE
jgi:hypothetical protein